MAKLGDCLGCSSASTCTSVSCRTKLKLISRALDRSLHRNKCHASSNRCLTSSNKCHATRSKNATSNKCHATRSKDATFGAPGLTTRSKNATRNKGIATRSKKL